MSGTLLCGRPGVPAEDSRTSISEPSAIRAAAFLFGFGGRNLPLLPLDSKCKQGTLWGIGGFLSPPSAPCDLAIRHPQAPLGTERINTYYVSGTGAFLFVLFGMKTSHIKGPQMMAKKKHLEVRRSSKNEEDRLQSDVCSQRPIPHGICPPPDPPPPWPVLFCTPQMSGGWVI